MTFQGGPDRGEQGDAAPAPIGRSLLWRLVVDHLPTLLIAGLVAVPVLDHAMAVDRARSLPRVDYEVRPVAPDATEASGTARLHRPGRPQQAVVTAPVTVPRATPADRPRDPVAEPAPAPPAPSPEGGLVDQVLESVAP